MSKKIFKPIKGVDSDSSYDIRGNDTFLNLENFEIISSSSDAGSLKNIKGINCVIKLTIEDSEIVKIDEIDDYLVVFAKRERSSRGDKILLFKKSELSTSSIVYANTSDFYFNSTSSTTYHKLFDGDLGLWGTNEINIRTNIETSDIKKIYFMVEGQPLRAINIVNSDVNDIASLTVSDLDFKPVIVYDNKFSAPIITKTTSGNLISGIIQYVYRLYKSNGSESSLSAPSNPYNITEASDTATNSSDYYGSGYDKNTGKGTIIEINDIPTDFANIVVYAIHYLNEYDLPQIRVIFEGGVDSTSIHITDLGSAIDTITPEELLAKNVTDIEDGLLSSKSNYLFFSNFTEKYFDIDTELGYVWDARAYCFLNSDGVFAPMYDANGDSEAYIYKTGETSPSSTPSYDWDSVPDDLDLVNRNNDLVNSYATTQVHQSDGTTFGAEGPNITITPTLEDSLIYTDSNSNNAKSVYIDSNAGYKFDNFSYAGHASPDLAGSKKLFLPGDVYRLGIQWCDEKGVESRAKWIIDYKIPELIEANDGNRFYSGQDGSCYKGMYLNITIKNPPINPTTGDEYLYRIMMVKREDSDIGIHYGIVKPLYNFDSIEFSYPDKDKISGEGYYYNLPSDSLIFRSLRDSIDSTKATGRDCENFEFICPDYVYGKNVPIDSLKIDYVSNNLEESETYSAIDDHLWGVTSLYQKTTLQPETGAEWTDAKIDITEYKGLDHEDSIRYGAGTVDLDGYTVYKGNWHTTNRPDDYPSNYPDLEYHSSKGRTMIFKTSSSMTTYENSIILGHSVSDNASSRYNGLSYDVRKYNTYVPLTQWTSGLNDSEVRGDCFVSMFDYLSGAYGDGLIIYPDTGSWSENVSGQEVIKMPFISIINANMTTGTTPAKESSDPSSYLMTETAGVHYISGEITNDGTDYPYEVTYTQDTDLYLYNLTYSKTPDLFQYYEKRDSDIFSQDLKYRIYASYKKIDGETVDNWLKLNPSTFIDVDSKYGEISKLFIFKNKLYFAQEKAIGTIAVDEQATTNTSDSGSVVIGKVDVMSRYDYITTESGISDYFHLTFSDDGIYWYDSGVNKMMRLGSNGIEDISKTKNIRTLLDSLDMSNTKIFFDKKKQFIFASCIDDSVNKVLVFDENLDKYIGLHNYGIDVSDSLYINESVNNLIMNGQYCYFTYTNDYNRFGITYMSSEDEYNESKFTIRFNPQNNISNIYDLIEIIGRRYDGSTLKQNYLIDSIRFYNEYWDTGVISLTTSGKLKDRFGTFRFNEIRDSSGGNRIFGNYIDIDISFKNKNDSAITNHKITIDQIKLAFTEITAF